MTATERYAASVERLNQIVAASDGKFSQKNYYRELENLQKMLPEVQKRQQSKDTGTVMNEGVSQELMSHRERYTKRATELNQLLADSDITAQTHSVMMSKLTIQSYQEMGSTLVSTGSQIAVAGTLITGSLAMLGRSAINQAKDFEQTKVSFEAMLGSQQQAQKMLDDLTKFAAATPFTMPTLLSATKMLLQFKVASKDVMGILKSIGDVTGGSDPSKVQAMAYAFAQMTAAGRLMGQDLMQMINAGFNPLNEMVKTTGKSLTELREEMSEGRISAEMVKEAFANASDRLDLMGKQSQTVEGRMSTLTDNIGLFWRSIGERLLPIVGAWVDAMSSVTGWFQQLSPEIKTAIAYGGLFAVVIGSAVTATAGLLVTVGYMVYTQRLNLRQQLLQMSPRHLN
jgi:tape measure domain-containing protein